MTAAHQAMLWCTTCRLHLADETGLCPVCKPGDEVLAATDVA